MLWRYVKAQGMVLLCGGLVGPIFLGVYFATGQSDLMRWMFWVGLLVTAVDVLAALAIVGYGAKAQAKSDQLEAHGVLGLAQIIGMAETNTRINDRPVVRLNLRISGPGIATFDAEDRVIADVTRLAMLTARRLAVLVDPATGEFQIDWERTALINGQVPATFSIAEDNTTYDLSGQAEPLMEILQILKANGIGMNSMVDLRNNPGARAQVQAVVRRAAAQQAAPQAPPAAAYPPAPAGVYPPPIPEPSTAQRLQELETLRATGAISDDEYADKRRQIIAEL
ncbi:SHOCT domain-containing protein [Mycobacterium frederiksbergense]|uniref:SHOCT domain-containing protein n=1 Tax=Mycolicibacterium frederiksbergense TaxID=117567 RepID=UPI0021F31690|nr:SHOCT domain-containing protein [Mycolicibacterium frederiksbergense]MCV7047046.1 SHOCT domain-containing protein [Mycolicibacterium frederiksbergense]